MKKYEAEVPTEKTHLIDEEYGYKLWVWVPPEDYDLESKRQELYESINTSGLPGWKAEVLSYSAIDKDSGRPWHSDPKFQCTKKSFDKGHFVVYVKYKGKIRCYNANDLDLVLVDYV